MVLTVYFLASTLVGVVVLLAWHRRSTRTGRAFFWLMLSIFIWILCAALELLAPDISTRLLLVNFQFLGITYLPLAELLLVLAYLNRPMRRRYLIMLAAIPTLTNIIIWTNPLHHWFYGQPYFDASQAAFPVLIYDYQFWFYYVHAPTSYLYLFVGVILLVRAMVNMPRIYRHQIMLFLAAFLFPTITDIVYVFGYSPVSHFNLTPFAFTLSGIFFAWNLFGFQFLNLLPLARDFTFDHIQEGILVLDTSGRIVDLNLAARAMLSSPGPVVGKRIISLVEPLAIQTSEMLRKNELIRDVEVSYLNRPRNYEIRIMEIVQNGISSGWIIHLQDITERIALYNQLKELAIHDGLTGVYTRRHFNELLLRAISDSERRTHEPLSIVLFDVDRFKEINDAYGHDTGDRALLMLIRKCEQSIRPRDVLARWGGDEFIILLENTALAEALQVAERIRAQIETSQLPEAPALRLTCSLGVASTLDIPAGEPVFQTLFHLADRALYFAKGHGRNRTASPADLAVDE